MLVGFTPVTGEQLCECTCLRLGMNVVTTVGTHLSWPGSRGVRQLPTFSGFCKAAGVIGRCPSSPIFMLAGELEGEKLASPVPLLQGESQLSPAFPANAFRSANEFPSHLV